MKDKLVIKIQSICDEEVENIKINAKKNDNDKIDTLELLSVLVRAITNIVLDFNVSKKSIIKYFKYSYKEMKQLRKDGRVDKKKI